MKRHFRSSDTKRVPGRKRNLFLAPLPALTFYPLFALVAFFLPRTPPLYAGSEVTLMPSFVGTQSETWERFGVNQIPSGTSILGALWMRSRQQYFLDCSLIFYNFCLDRNNR